MDANTTVTYPITVEVPIRIVEADLQRMYGLDIESEFVVEFADIGHAIDPTLPVYFLRGIAHTVLKTKFWPAVRAGEKSIKVVLQQTYQDWLDTYNAIPLEMVIGIMASTTLR